MTDEESQLLSDYLLNGIQTAIYEYYEETKRKMSESRKGKPQQKLTCPHCDKTGGNTNMVKYHFDNCKKK